MEFITIPCHESLRPFIRNYWMINARCTATGTQQIFSNGAASLHFYLSQDIRIDDGDRHYRTVLFHQNMHKAGVVTTEGAFVIFGAEFVPFCSRVFFPNAPSLLGRAGGEAYASPEDLHDEEFTTLSKDIHAADNTEKRVGLLDDFFLKRLARFPDDDINMERLSDVFDNIVPTDGKTWTELDIDETSSGLTNEMERYTFDVTEARYVRIYCNCASTSTWNSMTEARVCVTDEPDGIEPKTDDKPNSGFAKVYDLTGRIMGGYQTTSSQFIIKKGRKMLMNRQ